MYVDVHNSTLARRDSYITTLQVYSIDLRELPVGEYAATVSLTTEAGGSVGEETHLWWSLSECARHGKSCEDSNKGHNVLHDGANVQNVDVDSQGASVGEEHGDHDMGSDSDSDSDDALREACPALGRTDKGFCDMRRTCTGHGRCQNGVCICEAGYMGQYCAHHVYSNASYLPARNPASWPGTCMQAYAWQQGTRQLVAALQHISRSHSCHKDQVMTFNTRMHGMGAQVCMYSCVDTGMV